MHSLDPAEVLDELDLDRPGLEAAKERADRGDRQGALSALLWYYRGRFPLPAAPAGQHPQELEVADNVVNHVFQWGPYEPAAYGDDVRWESDPRNDIEWIAAIYRFYWATPLAEAYAATRDERYGRAFVQLTSDWIAKHPLEERDREHPVYAFWRGYPWLDIQTGIRASRICQALRSLVHAEAFTPQFLGVLLASLYDHQVKTERLPLRTIHNKVLFELGGFADVSSTFPEFREARHWMEVAVARAAETLLVQTTADGVQREWAFGYHLLVLEHAVRIMQQAQPFGLGLPDAYRERARAMYDFIFAIATPDLGFPMFGDCARPIPASSDRSSWPLYHVLSGATELLGDPKYAARARLDRAGLPAQTSYAFSQAGMYALRDEWGPRQVYMALHCSPPPLTLHDQPDNGTFELYAYGRWLMTDSGFYVYGHDQSARAWHRQTRVHQTLTLDEKDSKADGRELLCHLSPHLDALVVENRSYEGLTHRRNLWFVEKRFFVLLDEAIGDAAGTLDLNFQFAVGDAAVDCSRKQARTCFQDANVLVWADPAAPVTLSEEQGWFSWDYGHRRARKAIRFRHLDAAPAVFLTLLVPYEGTEPPEASAAFAGDFRAGGDSVELVVRAFGRSWAVGRSLDSRTAWCEGR